MLLVVTIVIGTHNLAIGVIFGIAAYYIAFLLNFFVSSKKDVIVSFILLGVAIAIAPFGMGCSSQFLWLQQQHVLQKDVEWTLVPVRQQRLLQYLT